MAVYMNQHAGIAEIPFISKSYPMKRKRRINEMKKLFKLQWLSVLMLALVLVGCGTKEDTNKEIVSKEDQQVEKTTSYKVKDDRGVEVEFNAVPKTIVSLQPSNTEILFALGVGDKIVGATEFDTYPEEAKKLSVFLLLQHSIASVF